MVKNQKEISEEKTTAASYILTFYQEIAQLTDSYAQYRNILVELETKYKDEESLAKMEDNEKNVLVQFIQQVRYFAHKVHIKYLCITQSIENIGIDKEEAKLYQELNSKFIISRKHLENYVIKVNQLLIDKIMKHLLETSQDFVGKVFEN